MHSKIDCHAKNGKKSWYKPKKGLWHHYQNVVRPHRDSWHPTGGTWIYNQEVGRHLARFLHLVYPGFEKFGIVDQSLSLQETVLSWWP